MSKRLQYLVIFSCVLILAACGTDNDPDKKKESEHTLRIGVTQNEKNAEYKGLEEFKEAVETRTNGDVEIELYHSDQLASIPDLVEQASVGTKVGTIVDGGVLGDIKEEFYIMQSPYMFDNIEEINKFLETDLFEKWVNELAEEGLMILSFNWNLGERNLATKKKIESVEDVKGTVIRTNGSDIVDGTVSAMGGSPSGMPWSEAYPGIEQGVIDGVEAHNLAIYESSMYEVINHIAKTNHYQLLSSLTVSADWFNDLPEDYQSIVLEEATLAGEYGSDLAKESSEEYEQNMKDEGVEFHEVDRDKFKEVTKDVYTNLGLEEVRQQVLDVLE